MGGVWSLDVWTDVVWLGDEMWLGDGMWSEEL